MALKSSRRPDPHMAERRGPLSPPAPGQPEDVGWDPVAEQWNAWSPVTDAMFGPATTALLAMLDLRPGEKVLELAAGSGGLTLHLAQAVGPSGQVIATDLGPKLLQFTEQNARAAGFSNVVVRVMNGQNADLPENSTDAVACRQALMLFPDPASALRASLRVLRPSGRLGVTVFSTLERNGFLATPIAAVSRWAKPNASAKGTPESPGPFSLGAPGQLEEMFARTGFIDVKSRLVSSSFRARTVDEMMRFYREVLTGLVSDVPEAEKERAWTEIAQSLSKYVRPGSAGAPIELLVVTGRKPARSERPGS